MNKRGSKTSSAIDFDLIDVLKKVKRGAGIDLHVRKVDMNVNKIDMRVAAMNKGGARTIIQGSRKIKGDLERIKRRSETFKVVTVLAGVAPFALGERYT